MQGNSIAPKINHLPDQDLQGERLNCSEERLQEIPECAASTRTIFF